MNIDDRIEALMQSAELLSHMHQDNEKRYAQQFEQHTLQLQELKGISSRLTDLTAKIVTVIQIHDDRLRKLEGNA